MELLALPLVLVFSLLNHPLLLLGQLLALRQVMLLRIALVAKAVALQQTVRVFYLRVFFIHWMWLQKVCLLTQTTTSPNG
jgi:hypothetical protein